MSEKQVLRIPLLYIVIPCYNEQDVLPVTVPLFTAKMKSLIDQKLVDTASKILFIDDGSADHTWELLTQYTEEENTVCAMKLSRNRGHQNALLAGYLEAKKHAEIVISADADGQDDIDAMDEMICQYREGADVVYGVRSDRATDTFFKRNSAHLYYRLLNLLGGEVVFNHADYCLVSSRVLEALEGYQEVNLFLRGIFPMIGFKSTVVLYERKERMAGESKYSLLKILSLAMDGITSFSIKPLRLITGMGIGTFLLSLLLIIYALISWFSGNTVPGWSSSFIGITLIGGVQLISLGVIGEYVGKIYFETKKRPRFQVEKTCGMKDEIKNTCE